MNRPVRGKKALLGTAGPRGRPETPVLGPEAAGASQALDTSRVPFATRAADAGKRLPEAHEVGEQVIAYSLYAVQKRGHMYLDPKFVTGFAETVVSRDLHFPGWTIRLYVDSTLAKTAAGRQILKAAKNMPDVELHQFTLGKAAMYVKCGARMLAIDDKSVGVALFRDIDAPLTARDAQNVRAWLQPTRPTPVLQYWPDDDQNREDPLKCFHGSGTGVLCSTIRSLHGYLNYYEFVRTHKVPEWMDEDARGYDELYLMEYLTGLPAIKTRATFMSNKKGLIPRGAWVAADGVLLLGIASLVTMSRALQVLRETTELMEDVVATTKGEPLPVRAPKKKGKGKRKGRQPPRIAAWSSYHGRRRSSSRSPGSRKRGRAVATATASDSSSVLAPVPSVWRRTVGRPGRGTDTSESGAGGGQHRSSGGRSSAAAGQRSRATRSMRDSGSSRGSGSGSGSGSGAGSGVGTLSSSRVSLLSTDEISLGSGRERKRRRTGT